MEKSILVTGGARSGKSVFAERLIRDLGGPATYIATAQPGDAEMADRIARHKDRRGPNWTTVEEPLALTRALRDSDDGPPRLVDCLTLWLSNLMLAERDTEAEAAALVELLPTLAAPVVFVTNEVGLGIVPDTPLGRRFRDAAGALNHRVADACDSVYLVVAGTADESEAVMTVRFADFDAILAFAQDLPQADAQARDAARARQDSLTKPPGALGRLEDLAIFMAGWQGRERPRIDNAQALVFAGNHGVCAQGVNPFPQEVTAQMVANFRSGGAAINQLCDVNGAALEVIALDLDQPTADITRAAAMDDSACLAALNTGAAAVRADTDILLLGEMGIGNSTIAAALAAACFGGTGADWAGRGTGSDDAGVRRKIAAIDTALATNPDRAPFAILSALGGREQAAICGAILAARHHRIPVMLDGYICTAAAGPLHRAEPALLDHCLVGHLSAEPGHARLLDAMDKSPVLRFDMRLGEGSGAALALGILRSALACHNGMATFAEAAVSSG